MLAGQLLNYNRKVKKRKDRVVTLAHVLVDIETTKLKKYENDI